MNYFSKNELKCKHCNEYFFDKLFLRVLNSIRKDFGKPIIVNSAYRCKDHDLAVGGTGNHTTGKAIDIKCSNSRDRFKIVKLALQYKFVRIGISKSFIHLDMNHDKPQNVIWLYT